MIILFFLPLILTVLILIISKFSRHSAYYTAILVLFELFFGCILYSQNFNDIFGISKLNLLNSDVGNLRLVNVIAFFYLTIQLIHFGKIYKSETSKKRIFNFMFCAVILFVFLLFYDWNIIEKLNKYIIDGSTFIYLISLIDTIMHIFIAFIMLMPIFEVIKTGDDSQSPITRRLFVCNSVCILLLNFMFFILYGIGGFRPYSVVVNNQFASININVLYLPFYVITFVATLFQNFFIMRYDTAGNLGIIRKRMMRKNILEINANLINIFHSFKNIIFTYQILVRKAKIENGDEREKTLDKLDTQISDYISKLSKMLDINNEIDINEDFVSVEDIVDDSLLRVSIPEGIEVVKKYTDKNPKILADVYYLSEAFANIIQNAVDAINKKKKTGVVVLKVDTDKNWSIVEISDDGIGMNKKDVKKVFKPFYTTKSRISNWGIGLSYSLKIIRRHFGYVYIRTNKNVGSTFYVYLPRA